MSAERRDTQAARSLKSGQLAHSFALAFVSAEKLWQPRTRTALAAAFSTLQRLQLQPRSRSQPGRSAGELESRLANGLGRERCARAVRATTTNKPPPPPQTKARIAVRVARRARTAIARAPLALLFHFLSLSFSCCLAHTEARPRGEGDNFIATRLELSRPRR